MKKSIATVSLPGTLPEKLQGIASAGFAGVEIFEPNLQAFAGSAAEVARMAADLGLAIEMLQPLRDFEGVAPEEFAANLERAERTFDVMEDLGAPLLLVCANATQAAIDDIGLAAHQLHELAERAGRRGLRIGFEALAWSRFTYTYDRADAIVQRADSRHLGLILDSFHSLIRPDDWSGIAQLPRERIAFLQVGDAKRVESEYLLNRRNHSRMPGKGELDVAAFVRAVMATGYDGPLSLEIFNERSELPPSVVARDAMDSLGELERQSLRAS